MITYVKHDGYYELLLNGITLEYYTSIQALGLAIEALRDAMKEAA